MTPYLFKSSHTTTSTTPIYRQPQIKIQRNYLNFFHSHLTIGLQLIEHTSPGSQVTPANDATSLIKFHTKGEIYTSKITHPIGQRMNLPVPDFRHPQGRNISICISNIFHVKVHYLKFEVHFYYKYYHSQ